MAERLSAVKEQLPPPVFWLMGKTQAGKSAVARAMTGDESIAVGSGFAATTREAQLVDFPDAESPLLRFLDTRGLGEVGYESDDDLARFSDQAQVILAVANAMDPDQEALIRALAWVRRKRPGVAVILVQTTLHQGYPDRHFEHIQPYPFGDSPWPVAVPERLTNALTAQRGAFGETIHAAVPVDFTTAEDGYEPRHYGVDALWAAIESAYPSGLRQALVGARSFDDLYRRRSEPRIIAHAVTAALAELVPVPGVAAPAVLAIQARMCRTLARIYRQPLDRRQWTEIAASVGGGLVGQLALRQLAKLIPGLGVAVASAGTGAATYALGQVLCLYFRRVRAGAAPDGEQLRAAYAAELARGRDVVGRILKARGRQ